MYTAIITLIYGIVETLNMSTHDALLEVLWSYSPIMDDVAILHDGRVLPEEEVVEHLHTCWDVFVPDALEASEA